MKAPAALFILLAAATLLSAAPAGLENLDQVELNGFQTNGAFLLEHGDSPEEVRWRIQGDKAKIQTPLYLLEGFRMSLQGRPGGLGAYTLESPQCSYDHQLQQVRGNGPIRFQGEDGLQISGIGFDFYLDSRETQPRLVLREMARISFSLQTIQDARHTPPRGDDGTLPR